VRTFLAVAVVSAVVASVNAQAPSIPGPTFQATIANGKVTEVRLHFADGSELRADNMALASELNASRFQTNESGELLMFEGGEWKPIPNHEVILSGDVRLRMSGLRVRVR
jgi:hypothetical protein